MHFATYKPWDHTERDPGPFNHDAPSSGIQYLVALLHVPSRFFRGGPKTVIHFTAIFAFIFLMIKTKSLSASSSTVFLAQSSPRTWQWTTEVKVVSNLHTQDNPNGLRIVVFGQDDAATPGRMTTVLNGARMPAWTDVMCDELNCDTLLSFIPLSSKTNQHALTSNSIHLNHTSPHQSLLPDLSQQIDFYLSLPMKPTTSRTIYIITLGSSDIHSLTTNLDLSLELSKKLVSTLSSEIFTQIERLYTTHTNSTKNTFQVLIPTLLDPTIFPGWNSHSRTTTISEKETALRNAASLTRHWNDLLKDKLDAWVFQSDCTSSSSSNSSLSVQIERDAIFLDSSNYILDILREHSFVKQGLDDKTGTGRGILKGGRFENISGVCYSTSSDGKKKKKQNDNKNKKNIVSVCENPNDYLFWNKEKLGPRAVKGIGRWAAEVMRNEKTVRAEMGRGVWAGW
ncbi:hypothetical protein QBC38DRAFT_491158 [Podospora fimiseda]|uniref:Uncharacterized protein n=1 Tax=Podospora fimiseda TaxID=252190 RepID=A0AAN6YSP5_9PEZI|nr:hypothetical protein QBC38DRAFT_491158 [Podospora fimiseda]